MSLYPVINQVTGVIGELDVDDCAPTATIWAARAADKCARKPTIPEFRKAAGNPDDPQRADGLTQSQLVAAIPKIWPLAKYERIDTRYWATFLAKLKTGRPMSIAVNSAHLPSALRYGFYANHRVGVQRINGVIYLANPLARNGSAPQPISEADLRYAMSTLIGALGWYLAIAFEVQPVHLRYGGRKTSPFPDRTRAVSSVGYIRSAPRSGDGYRVRRLVAGELFVAYQVTDEGDAYRGSRRWYGNHRGDRWVHSIRLTGKGGSS